MSIEHIGFRGAKWIEGPVWWQVGVGLVLLLLAGIFSRHVPRPPRQTDSGASR